MYTYVYENKWPHEYTTVSKGINTSIQLKHNQNSQLEGKFVKGFDQFSNPVPIPLFSFLICFEQQTTESAIS